MQNQNCGEKPKINRLKRANRSKKSDLLNEVELIRPDDQKSSHTSTMKNTRPPNTSGSRDLLNMETSSAWCPQQSSGRLSTRGGSDLHGHKATSPLTSLSHNLRSPSQFIGDVHTREEILQQVQTQNPHFPVRRVFQTLLLMRLGESNPVVPVTRKRKQEVESHSDGCFSKRRRSCQGGSETLNTSKGHVSSGHETINRLRRNPLPVRDAAVDQTRQNKGHAGHSDDVKHTTDVEHTDDVPLTEKFRPRSCDEVIGNSAVVRKLYSWLKEWRTRADVEERGKRREERQIKKKSNGSWDCGDFEGDPQTEECERELCNTLLIHGPTGAGKSAAVYACAEQLGFKVLEVNSSSLRTGRLVLSQLSESTQSHQVGAPQRSVSHTRTPAQKSVPSCGKPLYASASGKKPAAAQTPVTLTGYFWKTGKLTEKHSGISEDTKAADEVTLHEEDKKSGAAVISLILFEEVDIVFEEDVGFLAAVKSLMTTTKRPIILTANGEAFDGRFEKICFKTPAMESVVSFLQCVCVVQSVKPDLKHIRFLLQENNGDVRQSVLQLELWSRSGAGNTHHHLHNRAVACSSYAELESSRCVEVLVDCWRKGRSLLYSFLDLLAPPTDKKADQSNSVNEMRKRFRLNVKMKHSEPAVSLDSYKQMDQSAAEAGDLSQLDSLAHFFDTVSFVDSHLSPQTCPNPGRLRAKVTDGLLDELRDEDEDEMKTHSLERCYEIQAVVEGLGFHRCRMKACPMKQDVTGKDDRWKLRERRMRDMIHRLIHSEAFRYHGAQTPLLTDYLPCLRFICREQQPPRLGRSHYLREIGLRLPKNLLNLLASPLH